METRFRLDILGRGYVGAQAGAKKFLARSRTFGKGPLSGGLSERQAPGT